MVFTEGSLKQLKSHGFSILYLPYESIVEAFAAGGIDAAFDERTPDEELQTKVDAYEGLSGKRKRKIVTSLKRKHQTEFDNFIESLEASLTRKLVQVFIATLHGPTRKVKSIDAAIRFIENYDESQPASGFVRYEIHARYSNGDRITGDFKQKRTAIAFLKSMQ